MSDELRLDIDQNSLPEEWQGQASLMLHYGTMLADATLEMDKSKAKLAVIAAQLDREVREDPQAYGLAKATESTVPGAVAEQPLHKAATREYLAAKHRVAVLRAAVDALEHRKRALSGMTDLFLRQWFAEPTNREQPGALQEAAGAVARRRGRRRARAAKE